MILPFQSGHHSVVFENSLTSVSEITGAGGTLRPGAVVDGELGIRTDGTGNGCCVFDLGSGYDSRLNNGFQISFETEWQNICVTNGGGTPTPHGGYDHDADHPGLPSTHFAMGAGDAFVDPIVKIVQNNTKSRLECSIDRTKDFGFSEVGRSLCKANGDFARVLFNFHGNEREIFVNGVRVFSGLDDNRTTSRVVAGQLRYLMIGSVGINGWGNKSPYHYRNFTVSYMPAGMGVHPLTSNIVWLGDSYVEQSQSDTLSGNIDPYRSSIIFAMQHEAAQRGYYANVDISAAVAGTTIYTSGANIADQIPAVLAKNPRIVCYRGGTNDAIYAGGVGVLNSITTLTDPQLKAQMTTILNHPTVEYVILGTVPTLSNSTTNTGSPDYSAQSYFDAVDAVNDLINSMPAWASANGFAGRIIVVDQFTRFGGHTPITDLFQPDNIHPGSYGKWEQGKVFAEGLSGLMG